MNTVTATAFSERNATGTSDAPYSITFTTVDDSVSSPPPAAPIPTVSYPSVQLVLIYTGSGPLNNKPVADLAANKKVTVVNLAELGLASFNIDAVVDSSTVKSTSFSNGQKESRLPFAYCGNSASTFYTCSDLGKGLHNITMTLYPQGQQQGTPFPDVTVTFRIEDSVEPPVPAPVNPPVPAPVENPPSSRHCAIH